MKRQGKNLTGAGAATVISIRHKTTRTKPGTPDLLMMRRPADDEVGTELGGPGGSQIAIWRMLGLLAYFLEKTRVGDFF